MLEEEEVTYVSREVDIVTKEEQRSEWYLKMNQAGVVPTLVWRSEPVSESRDISIFVVDNVSTRKGGLLSGNRSGSESNSCRNLY